MTLEEYTQNILRRLGDPFVDVDIKSAGVPDENGNTINMVPLLIQDAFQELKSYIDEVYYLTIPGVTSKVDLTEYHVRTVASVMRGSINSITAPETVDGLLFSPIALMTTQSQLMGFNPYSTSGYVQDFASSLQYRQLRNTISPDLDFTYDYPNHTLYIYQQIPTSPTLTIAYNKEYEDVSEIKDPFWINCMIRLGLAYVKESLGRARSKYELADAPYTLDGEQLLSEAQAELTEIRQFLNDNNEMFFPID